MATDGLKIGDRVEINFMQEKALPKPYVSQIEYVVDGTHVLLHVPTSYGELVKLPPDETYSLLMFTEKGMIAYDGKVVKYVKNDGFYFMAVKLLTEGKRVQRRVFFRHNCMLPLKFTQVDEKKLDGDAGEVFDAITKDVGAGGVRFVTNGQVGENAMVKIVLMLDGELLVMLGRVLQQQYFPKSDYKYQYRVRFLGISDEDKEKIVSFIFNEQRKKLQKSR